MKHLLILITELFWAATVFAKCGGSGISAFPKGSSIAQNPVFVVVGCYGSQDVILNLNKKHTIYLKSGDKKIKLLVTEICVGQYHLTQAILKPATELEAGLEYTMHIDKLPQYQDLHKYNDSTQKYETVTYKVVSGKDIEKPELTSIPKEFFKSFMHYGCGPAIYVHFTNPAKDKSEIIVKTTVKDMKTGKETTYYVEPEDHKISLGHAMCTGAFNFTAGNNYEVEFSFMDTSGNLTTWTGERIKFTGPKEED